MISFSMKTWRGPCNSPLLLFRDYQSDSQGNPLFVCKQLYNTQNMIFYL